MESAQINLLGGVNKEAISMPWQGWAEFIIVTFCKQPKRANIGLIHFK